MSAAFTTQLRVSRPTMEMAPGEGTITIRVQASDLWDTVRVSARPDTPVADVKRRVIEAVFPAAEFADDFVLKLRGWEMLDHHATLAESGVVNGSILLLAHRRRRPVR